MFKKLIALVMALVISMSMFAMNVSAVDTYEYGDANMDKSINSFDALVALQVSTGLMTLTNYQKAFADVDASGSVNATDALYILQRATGLMPTFEKSTVITNKKSKVDDIINSGKFTLSTVMEAPEMEDLTVDEVDMILSTDGKNKVISTIVTVDLSGAMAPDSGLDLPLGGLLELPVEMRLLNLNGKNYEIIDEITLDMGLVEQTLVEGSYAYTNEDIVTAFDSYILLFTSDMVYSSKTQEKIGSKTYTCETYCNEANTLFKYYFYNGALALLTIENGENTQTFEITGLTNKADTKRLSIPDNYVFAE